MASNKSRLGARYMLSPYHAEARSNRESPVWNGPPSEESFAAYKLWMLDSVSFDMVRPSITSALTKAEKASSSWRGSLSEILKTALDSEVPSFSYPQDW